MRNLLWTVAISAGCLGLVWPANADDRTTVRFRYACSSELGRRDVTLYASGTVRLREGLWESQEMYLDELPPEALESYLGELREIQSATDEPEMELPTEVVRGEWVEKCEIRLALPGAEPLTRRFTAYEIPPLQVVRLINVAESLAEDTRLPDSPQRLPVGYEPQRGDVLRTAEGERFEVIGLTSDDAAVELQGLDSPLRIYVARDDLDEAFAALEAPGDR